MAMLTKSRGRKPVAQGRLTWTHAKGVDFETFSITMLDEEQDKYFSVRMNREETEKVVARLQEWLDRDV